MVEMISSIKLFFYFFFIFRVSRLTLFLFFASSVFSVSVSLFDKGVSTSTYSESLNKSWVLLQFSSIFALTHTLIAACNVPIRVRM
jgi:hypothetical protein